MLQHTCYSVTVLTPVLLCFEAHLLSNKPITKLSWSYPQPMAVFLNNSHASCFFPTK